MKKLHVCMSVPVKGNIDNRIWAHTLVFSGWKKRICKVTEAITPELYSIQVDVKHMSNMKNRTSTGFYVETAPV